MKRGEIAIGVVIVIALGLAVLITLTTLLVSGGERLENTANNCAETYGATCMTRSECIQQDGRAISDISCSDDFTQDYQNNWRTQTFPLGGGVCCVT